MRNVAVINVTHDDTMQTFDAAGTTTFHKLASTAEAATFWFPQDWKTVPVVLPSLESEVRIAFDRVLDEAGIYPLVQAEVDDMARMRGIARGALSWSVVGMRLLIVGIERRRCQADLF